MIMRSLPHVTRVFLLSLSVALALSTTSGFSQTSDADALPSQNVPDSTNARSREAQHHEAGSVEASGPAMKDRVFLRAAVLGGMSELQLSQLAGSRAASEDVRAIAAEMVTDHMKIANSFEPIADAEGVKLPKGLDTQHQATYDTLKGESGEAFDTAYLRIMTESHHRDLREFRQEAASTLDDNLRAVVQDATKIIHQHMVAVDQLARSRGIQVNRPQNRTSASTTHP